MHLIFQAGLRECQIMRYTPQTWALPCLMVLLVMTLMPFLGLDQILFFPKNVRLVIDLGCFFIA